MVSIKETLHTVLCAFENQTRIRERRNEHLAFALTMFSPLSFYFSGKFIKRGWVQTLFLGDTRTGKSEIAEGLLKFYKQGRMISAENTSLAGLIGGIEQVRNKRFLKWGALPLMDKRMIVIDEISGMSYEDIGRISGIRSSGIAEITKIITARTNARVRQVWLSNPRKNKFLHDYNTSIEAVPELIKNPEDIARFDMALLMKEEDVSFNVINSPFKEHDTKYTQSIARLHLMFTWSRHPRQYKLLPESVTEIMKQSVELSKKYSPEIPLVHSAEMRIKLARLSISLAALVFSIDKEDNIIIKPEHVSYIVKFLQEIYNKSEYHMFSEPYLTETSVSFDSDEYRHIEHYGKDKFVMMLKYERLSMRDMFMCLGIDDREEGRIVINNMMKLNLLKKKYQYYFKTKGFIELLKKWKIEITKEATDDDIPF